VTHVLSILGPNSPDPPEFAAFAPHRRLILRFHDVIEPQPDLEAFSALVCVPAAVIPSLDCGAALSVRALRTRTSRRSKEWSL